MSSDRPDERTTRVVESLDEVTAEDCNKWFYCPRCDVEYRDPYAEVFDDALAGSCVCGDTHSKPLKKAFQGVTKREKRTAENQSLGEYA